MKQFVILFAFLLSVGTTFAQRVVYVDTEYILEKLPQYDEALQKLETYTVQWQEEIAEKETELATMKANFEEKKLLLPENMKLTEEDKIKTAESELRGLKRKRFGVNGDLFQTQQNLIQPIQNEVYQAVKKMAEQRDYDFVLDKATGVSILFVKPKFDMSDEVLRIMNKNLDN